MTFFLTLTIQHPSWDEPIYHMDSFTAQSKTAFLKVLEIPNKQKSDLRNFGKTSWVDSNDVCHVLEFNQEAN